jgi:hypothetical protein
VRLNRALVGLAVLGSLACFNEASAQERTLRMPNGGEVIVWRNKAAHNEGMTLISSGVHQSNPMLLMRLISCIVPAGTKAIITDGGFATHDILVTSGQHSGCRGNVPVEFTR